MEAEYKGFGLEVATQRYINPNDPNVTRTGAEIEECLRGDVTRPAEITPANVRLYPDGEMLGKGEAEKARSHSPQDEDGKVSDGIPTPIRGVFEVWRARIPTCG